MPSFSIGLTSETQMSLLEISQLKKSFVAPDGSRHSVVDLKSFALAEKAQMALEGESGSGKTTLLNLIAGASPPSHESLPKNSPGQARLAQEAKSPISSPSPPQTCGGEGGERKFPIHSAGPL